MKSNGSCKKSFSSNNLFKNPIRTESEYLNSIQKTYKNCFFKVVKPLKLLP